MVVKTDLEIAQQTTYLPIVQVAEKLGLGADRLEPYGTYKAKINVAMPIDVTASPAKLILVTAINPTPYGEGKTTTTIGLSDALSRLGKKTVVALREPSLGPVFGLKGGATGGGYAQVVPMEDINLHFTGDFHAIGAANNLLCAMVDNHIYQGNALHLDPRRLCVRRCVDMNDRQLRHIVSGLGALTNGVVREDGFDITVASEVMAIFCLSESFTDLKERLGKIVVGYTYEGKPVFARDLKANGAMSVLLKDAFKPNLVQTLEGTPALIHGGPFANIAHGCNSVVATKLAMTLAEYVVTEAGFGADLGAQKFLDIKCRQSGLKPDCVVLVATVRALKYNGGVTKEKLAEENVAAVQQGLPNLLKHIENLQEVYHLPVVVAINHFINDHPGEIEAIKDACSACGVKVVLSRVWEQGSQGGIDLATEVLELCGRPSSLQFSFEDADDAETKIEKIAKKIYGAAKVEFLPQAQKALALFKANGFGNLPVCMAKTQYSLSDDPTKLARPQGFTLTIRDITLSNGAGFLVALTGEIIKMPGLPKVPAAESIDMDEQGLVQGLF